MILFFSPVFNLLSKSEKQAKLVFWGVELIPATDSNKSLQVAGDFHHKLLSYIKLHIDAAITEMEEQEKPTKQEPQATKPVAIKIQGDRLDTFTDILESATTGLDFKRSGDKVIVGILGKDFFGAYGIKDSQIWMEYRLTEYLEAVHSIDFDKILEGTDIAEITITDGYTPEELDARDSLFGSVSEQPVPSPYTPEPTPTPEEKIESPYSDKEEIAKVELAFNKIINTDPTEKVQGQEQPLQADEVPVTENTENFQKPETDSTEQIFDELKSESLKERMLGAKNKSELDKIKAEDPEAVTKIWDSLSIPEKNYIKCLLKSQNDKKKPATLGYKFQYTAPLTKAKYEATYLGYYLHGEAVTDDDKRAILVEGEGLICNKNDLKPWKKQPALTPEVKTELESIITNPVADTEDTAPTADEIAENTFTGLVPAPKLTGTAIGNQQGSQVSKQSVEVQPELDLKTPEAPEPEQVQITPTPLLEAIEQEVKRVNPELTFAYDTNGKSTFLEISRDDYPIGTFEDDGENIWTIGCKEMIHHGFSEEMIDTLTEIEIPKA